MSAGQAAWPFAGWHRAAVRGLGLPPESFWAMPLADWLALLGPAGPALDRAALTRMMEEYPDDET